MTGPGRQSEARVVVASFFNPVQAEMAAAFLQAEGFDVRLRDNHTVSIDPLYTMALGGVRLTATESEAAEVEEVLASFKGDMEWTPVDEGVLEEAALDADALEEPPPDEPPEAESIPCRVCGNRPVRVEREWKLLGIPLPFGPLHYRCETCQYRWSR